MKLIILDRDGVINYENTNYIRTPAAWVPIPGSAAAIAKLNRHGFVVAIATNQSGIARGYYSEATLAAIHQKMTRYLAQHQAFIDRIFYCPHLPEDDCACRKPKPGLLQQISEYYRVPLSNVYMVGDRDSDVAAAVSAGAKPVLIGHSAEANYPSLQAFVDELLAYET